MHTSACICTTRTTTRTRRAASIVSAEQYKLTLMQRDATTLEVTELPIRKWTQDYKEFLETLIKPEDKNAPALIEVKCVCLHLATTCASHHLAWALVFYAGATFCSAGCFMLWFALMDL